MSAPVLELEQVDAAYGPFRALFDVTFAIEPRTATALVGANGAGKTTVARISSGLVHPTAGRVRIDGTDVTKQRAFQVARLGVAHAPEGRSVLGSLTVEENLLLVFRKQLGRDKASTAVQEAYELFPKLADRSRQLAGSLSGGEQRMLSMARVMVNPPKLLVVDELSLGLAPIIVDEVYANLARVKEQGTALLVIEQHLAHALELADQVVVLERGRTRYVGPVLPAAELATQLLPGAR